MILFNFRARRMAVAASVAALATVSTLSLAAGSYSELVYDKVSKCNKIQLGGYTLSMTDPVGDTSGFNAFTPVVITVGQHSFTTQLGADCKYRAGAASARVQQVVFTQNGGALALDVQLNWGGGSLTAVVRGFPPVSGPSAGSVILSGAQVGPVNSSVSGSVAVGAATVSETIAVSGSATEKFKKSCGGITSRKVQLSGNAL